MSETPLKLDQANFLQQYSFTKEEFEQTGLSWDDLETICSLHASSIGELQATGDYIVSRLSTLSAVHSLKLRIKHPEHLVAKIIRKKLERPKSRRTTTSNYRKHITDLVGIRALHLFKDQWRPIHEFVKDTWALQEQPIAYVRKGDPDSIVASFRQCGCKVLTHKFGYRSVHYLISSQPARDIHLTELQVRTLFEEAWSEIDHQVRYARLSENPHLAEFLTIFNRLAGSADEMGTFIKALREFIGEQTTHLAETQSQLRGKESELKKAISQLNISTTEKKKLESQVSELRKSSEKRDVPFFGSQPLSVSLNDPRSLVLPGLSGTSWSPGLIVGGLNQRTCTKCGTTFTDDSFVVADRCFSCRANLAEVERIRLS